MQGVAHIGMTLDIAINFWLTDSYFRDVPEHMVLSLAGPISHNSIHLLLITTDFVALN